MATRFKHIHFTEEPGMIVENRSIWHCRNNKTKGILGTVTWYDDWNRWVFEGEAEAVFDHSCLTDIATFLKELK